MDRKLVLKGDFVINSRSDRRGSCGISNLDGSVSLINIVIEPRSNMNPNYYNWVFHTTSFANEFYKNGHGIVDDLWTTNWQDMKRMFIPIPPLEEQEKIAKYLDLKIPEIDKTINETKKTIELYKEYKKSVITEVVTKGLDPNIEMKDSGIEWIGEIPKDWEVRKIKNIVKSIGSGTTPKSTNIKYYENGTIPWIQSGDIYGKTYITDTNAKITQLALDECSALKIYKAPYIVVAMYGASVGNIAISNIDACTNQACCNIKTNDNISLEFLNYWLIFCKDNFLEKSEGGGQPNISQDKIKNQTILVLDKNTQQQIVDYLDQKCLEIDNLIKEKEDLVIKLEEYKKSLIYECVTGKKEIE